MSSTTHVPEVDVDATGPPSPDSSRPLSRNISASGKPRNLRLRSRSSTAPLEHSATIGDLSQFSRKRTVMNGSPTRKKTLDRFFKWAAGKLKELLTYKLTDPFALLGVGNVLNQN